jgi:hypothetical protein
VISGRALLRYAFDDAVDLGVVDTFGGTTAVNERVRDGLGVIQVRAAWKTDFVERSWIALLWRAGRAAARSAPC